MTSLVSRQLKNLYKTSPMREDLLNWYPFIKGSTVLERSGGVLTQLLHTKCAKVISFDQEYTGDDTFDYIVCVDPGQITVELLEAYRLRLNSHGRLLMAFDNPHGLQYFAGKRNPRTGLPFTFCHGESKNEVSIRLKQAGFFGQKWYYPFSNHYFTREVYSENYLPNEFLNHRGFIYTEDDLTKEFYESNLWSEIIRGGAFAFLCNSYLVEACVCMNDVSCEVDFAAITSYREREKAFITTVRSDGTARKQAVFAEGIARLSDMEENHNHLIKLGVNALPVTLENDYLTMERVDLPTLWDYWAKRLIHGELTEQELFLHFDLLREAIQKSAKDGGCYWEMVPANSFFNVEMKEIIFFDQEYCWHDMDPDMVLVRSIYALIYSGVFRSDPRTVGWIDALKERYKLKNKWNHLVEYADIKTRAFVFNEVLTFPLDNAVRRATVHAMERDVERDAERRKYDQMFAVADTLLGMGIKCPAIYGYGIRGKRLRYILEMSGMDISCIIDRKSPIVQGISMFKEIEDIPKEIQLELVIVTPFNNADEIANNLRKRVDCPVMTIEELIDE